MHILFLLSFIAISFANNNSIRKTIIPNQIFVSAKYNNLDYNYKNPQMIFNDELFANKKLITISPGGFDGFYLLGSLTYIKENYDTKNIIYSGASAGAWNGLFMCYNGDPIKFANNILTDNKIKKVKSLNELQYVTKYKLLTEYTDNDFDIKKLFIGVTTFKNLQFSTNIIYDFDGLEDAINCCIASSHIPLITGGLTNKYKNMYTFDGGFSKHPYLNTFNNILHVTPNMWFDLDRTDNQTNLYVKLKKMIRQVTELNYFRHSALELFDNGYQDAKYNKHILNIIFNKHQHIYYDDSDI